MPLPQTCELYIKESSFMIERKSRFILYSPFSLPIWSCLIFPIYKSFCNSDKFPLKKKKEKLLEAVMQEKRTQSSLIFIYNKL